MLGHFRIGGPDAIEGFDDVTGNLSDLGKVAPVETAYGDSLGRGGRRDPSVNVAAHDGGILDEVEHREGSEFSLLADVELSEFDFDATQSFPIEDVMADRIGAELHVMVLTEFGPLFGRDGSGEL